MKTKEEYFTEIYRNATTRCLVPQPPSLKIHRSAAQVRTPTNTVLAETQHLPVGGEAMRPAMNCAVAGKLWNATKFYSKGLDFTRERDCNTFQRSP
ncbi:hypothetical protein U1Q18_035461 [Sarracenia purpurea var. burkii]